MASLARISSLATLLLVSFTCQGADTPLPPQPEVTAFVDTMVRKHGFARSDLDTLFANVQLREDILTAIARPAEGKPWSLYRPIFVNEQRIRLGNEFWNENAATLEAAQREFGVPPQYIIAILGVETRYGRQMGKYRVVDALATLAFQYPPRSPFFRGQLEEYLLMAREEGADPLSLLGSYAGAMGQPQFMPSSFRKFAVDFDGDGRRDLWANNGDAVGSVANYFLSHGWRADAPVVHRARVTGADADYDAFAVRTLEPITPFAKLAAKGVSVDVRIPPDEKVTLLRLDGESGPEYWVARHNFFVITRYNRSALYALSVHQLGEAIAAQRTPSPAPPAVREVNEPRIEKKKEPSPCSPFCD